MRSILTLLKSSPSTNKYRRDLDLKNMHLFQVPSKLLISAYDLTTNNWAHPNILFKALLNELSFH